MSPLLARNLLLTTLGVLFALLSLNILEVALYLPGTLLLATAISFTLLGLLLVMVTIRQREAGMRRFFLLLTGYSAMAMPLAAILHNFILEVVLFILALIILPPIFLFSWLASLLLIATSNKAPGVQKRVALGLPALVVSAVILSVLMRFGGEGYSVTSELFSTPEVEIERISIAAEVEESLISHFSYSLRHSLVSALDSNGIEATMKLITEGQETPVDQESESAASSPECRMLISVRPLLREHRSGRQAIVGTLFDAKLSAEETGKRIWQASGKVDYIGEAFFRNPGYRADDGIRKEFAWHTTAAIVRTLMQDLYGRESAPIYTDTESRQRHGQRTD